jgi:hypothetical protein
MTVHEQINGTQDKALIKKDEGRVAVDEYQFERVVLCIQNVRDVASTLQPGYQLTTKICKSTTTFSRKENLPSFTSQTVTLKDDTTL